MRVANRRITAGEHAQLFVRVRDAQQALYLTRALGHRKPLASAIREPLRAKDRAQPAGVQEAKRFEVEDDPGCGCHLRLLEDVIEQGCVRKVKFAAQRNDRAVALYADGRPKSLSRHRAAMLSDRQKRLGRVRASTHSLHRGSFPHRTPIVCERSEAGTTQARGVVEVAFTGPRPDRRGHPDDSRGVCALAVAGLEIDDQADAQGRVTLKLLGELETDSVAALENVVERHFNTGARAVTLDLSALKCIDSTGLAAVVLVSRICERDGCALAIIPGPRPVQRMFEITGLVDVLPFYDSRQLNSDRGEEPEPEAQAHPDVEAPAR